MKKIYSFPLLVVFLFLLTGCPNGHRFDEGRFPSDPVNFADVNSIYDDYNSTSPVIENERYLYFSSNRNSNGNEFDIVGDNFHVIWDKDNGRLTVNNIAPDWKNYDYTDSLFTRMNSSYNELGPSSLPYLNYNFTGTYTFNELVVFSNDEPGHQELKFVWFSEPYENPSANESIYGGPEPIKFLNTAFNDAYLTFFGPEFFWNEYGVDPFKITELIFCSDRDGNFDIFQSSVPPDTDLQHYLQLNDGEPVIPVEILNTSYQDKCPFANGQLLVFTSDRPGGFGGFDLYYSMRNGITWSEPVNFGERINSAYDEYRPIIAQYYEFENDLLLFSSNRPGGKGGYDLYYVGISKMIY